MTARAAPLQRKCACGANASTGTAGRCPACERKKTLGLQTRLAVGAAHDPLEHEADRVADQVLRGNAGRPAIRRANATLAQPSSEEGPASASAQSAPDSVAAVLAATGRPLPPALREDMEQRFGHDFSRVRVHADAAAARAARDVGAHAWAVGTHIAFADGMYAPGTNAGRHLLAHELTHVVQQNAAGAAGRVVQCGGKKDKKDGTAGNSPNAAPSCGGEWSCASGTACELPDGKTAVNATPSNSWKLTAHLDLDVAKGTDISGGGDVGHAFVEFSESNGDRYTYGHYPTKAGTVDVFKLENFGCTVHPDTGHDKCVDMHIGYSLTQPDYTKALQFAQTWCKGAPKYHLYERNCTSFVERVVQQAGQSIPSSRGGVGRAPNLLVDVPMAQADNPNTLFDAHVSQADNASWRNRVDGAFSGHYDDAGKMVPFVSFKLRTDKLFFVKGDYSYIGSSGDTVEGQLYGRLVFDVQGASKIVQPHVLFTWIEPGGRGRGRWTVGADGKLLGSWGRASADSGAGNWELRQKP
ncbi:MAG: DUF4157 domain-containing protein [Acidovorax sp.]